MQNQKSWNDSNKTVDFSEEQLLLKGTTSCNISGRSCASTTEPEPTLASNDDFFTCPQAINIPSNLFSINTNTAMEPSILSTEYARIENIWDSPIPSRDNLPNSLSLIEQADSNSSVGSFGNPPQELLKQYNHELPSIMEDSTSEQCKPKTGRQRRNSLPLGSRGIKRKLSTGSDITYSIAECEQNSSNSSCDMTRSVESSDVLNTPAWSSCYSPYRKRTPSVASSEKGVNSLISKLFTEEEKQRFLAAKKIAQHAEEPKKKLKYLGLLGSEDKYFINDVACTSSINSSIFGDETILSKNKTLLQIPENPANLFKSGEGNVVKPSIESEINVVSSDTQLIDLMANPITSKNLTFLNELKKASIETNADPTNQQNTILLHGNVLKETSTSEILSAPVPLDSVASTEISVAEGEFGLTTESIENQFVTSVEIDVSSNIAIGNFSTVEISDSLENMFSASETSDNNKEKQSEDAPFIFVSENILSSVKPFVNISSDCKETTILSQIPIENPEHFQQENSEVKEDMDYSVISSDCKLPLTSKQLTQDLSVEGLHEQETELIQYHQETLSSVDYLNDNENTSTNHSTDCQIDIEEGTYTVAQSLERQDIHVNSLPDCKNEILGEEPKLTISVESISETHETQIIETPTIDFGYLEIPEAVLESQGISGNHHAQQIESSDMDYLVLHKTLLESHNKNGKGDIENTEIVIVTDSFFKVGDQTVDLETIQEVPNILGVNMALENQYFEPGGLGTAGFANGVNQAENLVLDISLEMYNASEEKPITEVLTLENSLYAEDCYTTIEDGHLLPNSIPITNGELEMLSFYANLEVKRSTKAKKSLKSKNVLTSPLEECLKTIANKDTSLSNSNLIESESEVTIIQPSEESVLQAENEMFKSAMAKKSCGGSRRASSESSNSIRRSSSDSCDRHNRTDSSSSADESDGLPSKRKHVSGGEDVNNTHTKSDDLTAGNSSAQRKTALKTFKKPFTVAKKSVDEKTAFKSVIQSYFGVRTALKTCSKTSNSKGRNGSLVDKNGSAIIISLQNKSDIEISPEEFSADESKSTSGSWSPLKDLPFLKSTCQCSAEEVPCLCNGETLQLICEAEDCIDRNTVPCSKTVSQQYLVTPSTKIKHRAFCDIHLTRLRRHHCCPKCGLFCTQGIFLHCSHAHTLKSGKENHFFHPACFIIPETGLPPSCPHCSKFSGFNQVQLSLIDTSSPKDTSQSSSVLPEGVNLMSDFENYQLLITTINKEKNITNAKSSEESLPKEELHAMLMAITKEKSLSLRPTGKCLFNPIKNGDVKKVMQLIVNGVDPNHKFQTHKNNTPLHIAAFYGYVGIVHLLLQYGALIDAANDDLETPLILAVEKNHLAVVKCLILAGAQVDAKNENGSTAFHLAAKNNYIAIAKLLFDTGRFDLNVKDDDGWTPLVWACEHNYMNLVQWLLELGADSNIQDNEENTALHWAACSGDCEILEMLLDNGCNLTFVNERGDSALHVAARKDHHACVKVLLSKGASLDCKNKDGETPNMCCDKGSKSFKIFKKYSSVPANSEKVSLQHHVVYRDISRGAETYPIQAVNEVDQQEFIMEFRYITRNCYAPDICVIATIDSMEKCCCKDNCNSSSCSCTKITKCWYDGDEHLVADFNMCDPPSIYECSKICHCPKSCINRVVQKGLRIPLQIFRTFDRGWGVRTLKSLPKGTFICEYIGEVITGVEVTERADDSYLFDLESKGGDYCIDGRFYGNVSRFINHSCEPNLVSIRVFVEHQDKNFPRIAFFTMRDVDALEELCFDYGTEFWVAKSQTVLCTCNSSLCKYSKDSIDETLQAYACEKAAEMLNM